MQTITEYISLKDFTILLKNQDILEIREPVWKLIKVQHGNGCMDYYQVSEYPGIRKHFNHLNKLACIYAYFAEGRCIYIGVSKNLRERLYQHLLESCKVWGHQTYRAMFSKYTGKVDVYYLPLGDQSQEGDYLRSIVEKILQVHHGPELKSKKL